MNSKLFAICVLLVLVSVISLSQANAVNTQFDQIDNVVSGPSEGLVRHRRDVLCDEAKCALECISKGNLLGGSCTLWFFCSCK